MLKNTIHNTFQGHSITMKELFKSVRKRPELTKVLEKVVVNIGNERGIHVAAKIVFVRDRS